MRTSTKVVALVGLLGLGSLVPAYAGQNINERQARQEARVEQGLRSGELTRSELRYLEERQAEVANLERRLRRDGLNHRERARLNSELDRLSREIYALKHNRYERPWADDRRVGWNDGGWDRGREYCDWDHGRRW